MKNMLAFMKEKYYVLFFLTIFSIFFTTFKLYIPLFGISIVYIVLLIREKEIEIKLSKWQKFLGAFMLWSIIGTLLTIVFYKNALNFSSIIKLNLNCLFLILVAMLFQQDYIKIEKKRFVKFIELIIILNFIQIVLIYIAGGLFTEFLQGELSKSSDTAYVIGQYNNIIGGDNKNIWASKLAFIYIIYIYTLVAFEIKSKSQYVNIILGGLAILLILSRTAQLAIAIPIVFYFIYKINGFEDKYSKPLFLIFGIIIGIGGGIFFEKFFHIKFDMTDGGFTRLLIWKSSLTDIWSTHWITGNGIGYAGTFISDVVGRTESNLHNVFLNIFLEMGLIGLVTYAGFMITFVKEYVNKNNIKIAIFLIIVPVAFIISLQYLGFDNDIIMIMILFLIVTKLSGKGVEYVK